MSTKTSKKTTALAMAGVVVTAIFAALAFSPVSALAQEREQEIAPERPHGEFKTVRGSGIATDTTTGENLRTGFNIVAEFKDDRSTPDKEYEIKRGVIILAKDGVRTHYKMLPETWSVAGSEDNKTFKASGAVVDTDDNQYRVVLTGYFGMHTRLGNIWSLEGSMTGEGLQYELHYVAISNPSRVLARN